MEELKKQADGSSSSLEESLENEPSAEAQSRAGKAPRAKRKKRRPAEGNEPEGALPAGEAELVSGDTKGEGAGAKRGVGDWFKRRYLAVDTRWLGVFRIVLGVILTVDLLRRWYHAEAFYTNAGILPNHYSLFAPMGRNVFSLYHSFSTYGEISVAFALTLVVFLCFLFGYRTKLFHILAAICITSLNARNIFVENGGTVVVNLITVWSLFLPLGARFSVDAVRRSLKEEPEQSAAQLNDRSRLNAQPVSVYRLVILALILQWSVIYFFNTVHKDGKGWMDGSAIHWFLYQDRIITSFGVWARETVPYGILQGFTYGTLVVEGLLSVILLIPFGQKWLRRLAFLLAFGLHGGIALCSRLGPFSYVMTSFFILMLGAADWELVRRYFSKENRKRVVVYDADCGVCLLVCRILKRLDPFERLEFVENTDLGRLPAGLPEGLTSESVLAVLPDGSYKSHEQAVFEIVRVLPGGIFLVWWLKLPGLSSLGRWLYNKVASNRIEISVWLGLGACGVAREARAIAAPTPKPWRESLARFGDGLRELSVLFLMIVLGSQVLMDNSWARSRIKISRPAWMQTVVDYPRLYQGWRMFAPEPPYDDGTMVVDARTADGRKLDPFTGAEPDFNPHTLTGWGHNQFWCDYQNRIRYSGHTHNRKHLVDYLLKYHERTGNPNDRLVAFDVWWIEDKSPPPGSTHGTNLPPKKLISHGKVTDSLATPWLNPVKP